MMCNKGVQRLNCGSTKTQRLDEMAKTLIAISDRHEISIAIKKQRAAGLEHDPEPKSRQDRTKGNTANG